ncbi:MAG: bL35 family ribosomal protein [Candidatus Daviesbacteria bacterium]|nr:bL35 family ribosomal protein [Candidatus Daviesbacteria bacterium]
MPKIKTKKALLKRIKITRGGKLFRSHQNRTGHLRRNKSKEALRRYHKPVAVHKSLEKNIRRMLGI